MDGSALSECRGGPRVRAAVPRAFRNAAGPRYRWLRFGDDRTGHGPVAPYHNVLSAAARQGGRGSSCWTTWTRTRRPPSSMWLTGRPHWSTWCPNPGAPRKPPLPYLLARAAMEERLGGGVQGRDAARSRLVFTTDPRHGVLRDIAQEEGISAFEVPARCGGRSRC